MRGVVGTSQLRSNMILHGQQLTKSLGLWAMYAYYIYLTTSINVWHYSPSPELEPELTAGGSAVDASNVRDEEFEPAADNDVMGAEDADGLL